MFVGRASQTWDCSKCTEQTGFCVSNVTAKKPHFIPFNTWAQLITKGVSSICEA